jgi:mannose-1-phosphate guanylyltransferase/mannose-6-phosphate isomerase
MLIPVILSGGAGSRLWPVSREAHPKPFITLPDGSTLLRRTLMRAARIPDVSTVVTVTNREYYFLTNDQYAAAGVTQELVFMLEPCARNTAPAVAMAAFYVAARHGPKAEILILPADHLIRDNEQFLLAVERARCLARTGMLVTFGVAPTRPETGYGYIECGSAMDIEGCYHAASFVEKPALDTATSYLASGRFLWNSGMFCFTAEAFLKALQKCDVVLYDKSRECWTASASEDSGRIEFEPTSFSSLQDISIDYAVMERHKGVAVVRAAFDWNDIGSWNALGELTPADTSGNRILGETILLDARNCYIQSDSRVIAAVGVENLIVVDTPDALLIADRDRVQDVKKVSQHLKLTDHATHRLHRTVHRPWGSYTVLEEAQGYKIKRIVVKPGASLSLQMHRHRSEHWVVISGTAKVINGEKEYVVRTNESTFIAVGDKHRLANQTDEELVIIEVQAGDYVGEDDIVRFDDVYGRN